MTYKLDPWSRIVYLHQYAIAPNFTTRNEGTSVVFTVTTTGIANGTVVYWKLVGVTGSISDADFSSPANPVTAGGTVTINNNTANFTVTISNDVSTEGTESFNAVIRTGSQSGTLRATSATVTISDTSPNNELTVPTLTTTSIIDVDFNSNGSKLAVLHDSSASNNYYATVYNVSGSSVSLSQQFGPSQLSPGGDHLKVKGTIDWSPDNTKLLIACGRGLGAAISQGPSDSTSGTEEAHLEVWQGVSKIYAVGSTGFWVNNNIYPANQYPDGNGSDVAGGARWVSNTTFVVDGRDGWSFGYGLIAYDYQTTTPTPTSYFPVTNYRYKINYTNSVNIDYTLENVSLRVLSLGDTFYYSYPYSPYPNRIVGVTWPSGTVTQTGAPTNPSGGGYDLESFDVSSSGYKVSGMYSWPNSKSDRNLFLYSGNTIAGSAVAEDISGSLDDTFSPTVVAISTDGTKIAVAHGLQSREKIIQIYSRSGTTLTFSKAFGPSFTAGFQVKFMKFNPQGSVLAVVGTGGKLKLFTV